MFSLPAQTKYRLSSRADTSKTTKLLTLLTHKDKCKQQWAPQGTILHITLTPWNRERGQLLQCSHKSLNSLVTNMLIQRLNG